MPRFKRFHAPGALVHIISRFVNREFRIRGPREREEYLLRMGAALARCDLSMLGYSIMSSHTHLLGRAGEDATARLIQPLNGGFAGWINKTQGRLGPVFAERHSTILCDPSKAGRLLAYLHNNPVRAGVVADPANSDWSSHRAYIGEATAPPWLDLELGRSLCGFDSTAAGRSAFASFVSGEREVSAAQMSSDGLTSLRAGIRRIVGAPVEISAVDESAGAQRVVVLARPGTRLHPRWPGDPLQAVAAVAGALGLPIDSICARGRRPRVIQARRLAMRVWNGHLGRNQVEMCAVLGISQQEGSYLLKKVELESLAWAIADDLVRMIIDT